MRRPLFNIILLTLIGVVAIWLGDRPGDLVLRWPGYELRTSVATGIGVTLVIFFILLVLWRSYAWLINWPERFKTMRRRQKKARGEEAMAGSLMSLAEGNVAEANRAALEAQNNLPDNALPLLLAAQAARMDSNHRLAEEKYKAIDDAYNSNNKEAQAEARKDLAAAFRLKAKTVNSKYIAPPKSTDFAIIYVPTEGLFSELSSYRDTKNKRTFITRA